jgi:hypothetical protein
MFDHWCGEFEPGSDAVVGRIKVQVQAEVIDATSLADENICLRYGPKELVVLTVNNVEGDVGDILLFEQIVDSEGQKSS